MNRKSRIVVCFVAVLMTVAAIYLTHQNRQRAAAERARKAYEDERGSLMRNTAGDRAELRKKAQMDARMQKVEDERRAAQLAEDRWKKAQPSIEQEPIKEPNPPTANAP